MIQTYILAVIGFGAGFIVAWVIRTLTMARLKKSNKSTGGFLESEKLIKERLQKENTQLHELKEEAQADYAIKVKELQDLIKMMDTDILLLQKSNEETEALLQASDPVVHSLKIKLIEANNTIARYKAQLALKEA